MIEPQVIGLEGNRYYINNPIFIDIKPIANGNSGYIEINFTNIITREISNSRVYYFNENVLRLDIAPYVKSLFNPIIQDFDYGLTDGRPTLNNYINITMNINRYYSNGALESKLDFSSGLNASERTYIRGGVREQGSNFITKTGINNPLRYSKKLPYWNGYPVAEYWIKPYPQIAPTSIMKTTNLNLIANKQLQPLYNENAYYIKFLNQLGAYSYWMFYGSKKDYSSTQLGYSNNLGLIKDYGSSENILTTINSRVPVEYAEMIPDLFISSDIWLFEGNNKWSKIISKGNRFSERDNKRAYDVEFKFEKVIDFNPSNLI